MINSAKTYLLFSLKAILLIAFGFLIYAIEGYSPLSIALLLLIPVALIYGTKHLERVYPFSKTSLLLIVFSAFFLLVVAGLAFTYPS
ncbi:hypothetical protein [Desmospora profundinema]|uniref:Membrane-bound ClpP family serine protease n=1 Tax=Desmospora profundinema TaxID=1571184 RepID=A0ABU1IJC8_9BACL|nr:hypothetical protein [Desmospora profundinema]MDR6224863.1 membrane-bound ClpP family serine protease [Desmospora profundinema]